MGPNGAGKSTCFNVLTGHFPPDRGRVLFDGEDITGRSPRHIARKGIARSFQIISLFDAWSALENVLFALPEVRGLGFNVMRDVAADRPTLDRALAVLEKVGLGQKAHVSSSALAYGERARSRSRWHWPASRVLLFLDEPTQGMGADGRKRLFELILELKRSFTIVMIEHDMQFLFSLADRISVIHWGR
jgi:branched-chain amino acid transport system ATP-binding protein